MDMILKLVCDISGGDWCPTCTFKTEKKLFDYLVTVKDSVVKQFKFPGLKNRRFDFSIPEYKLIIELDGDQHFRQVSNWTPPEEALKNDTEKAKYAVSHGYTLVRLFQPDVYSDKIDWQIILTSHFKLHDTPTCFYYSTDSTKYDLHKLALE